MGAGRGDRRGPGRRASAARDGARRAARLVGGRGRGDRLRVRGRRRGPLPRPALALAAGRRARAEPRRTTTAGSRGRTAAGAGARSPGGVLYELHVGTFTPEGTFDAAIERLDHLVDLGVDAVELMPVAAFPGRQRLGLRRRRPVRRARAVRRAGRAQAVRRRLPRARPRRRPRRRLQPPRAERELPRQVRAVLHRRVPARRGAPAVNLDGAGSDEVRAFIVDNALMWLRDYHLDGLRLDAVHAMRGHRARCTSWRSWPSRSTRLRAAHGPRAVPDRRVRPQRPAAGHRRARPAGTGWTRSGTTTSTTPCTRCSPASARATTATSARSAALAKTLTRVFFHDGTWSSFRGRTHGRPVDRLRTPGPPVRRLPAEPRPGRQPRHRRPDLARASSPGAAQGRRGAAADRAVHADAVHGRGVGRERRRGSSSPTTTSPSWPRAVSEGRRARVRRARLGRRGRARPAGPGDVPRVRARLGRARTSRATASCSTGTAR